ncbi:MAG: exosortase H [Geobacteraceae bacterium]|nr:exosortase H [Geobacteraceae bacterium]
MTKQHRLRFLLLCTLLVAAASWAPEHLFAPLNQSTAAAAGSFLGLLGMSPGVAGDLLTLDGFRVRIVTECTPLYMALLYSSFVLASPAPPGRKALGLLCGLPLLNAVNIVRLAAVVAVGAARPALFEAVHVYLGQVLSVLAVVIACLVWHRSASGRTGNGSFAFMARAAVISGLLFLPWLLLNRRYVAAGDYPIRFLFRLAGCPIDLAAGLALYYQTFNVVTFLALILATGTITARRKLLGVAGGLPLLWFGHQAFRTGNVLLSAFQVEGALRLSAAVHLFSSYFLPFLLWLAAVRHGEREGKLSP